MIWLVLAVLLLAIAAILIVAAVLEGAVPVEIDPAGVSVDTSVSGVFITGIVTGLLVLGGIAAVLVGIQQVRARRREIEYLRQRVAEQDRMARPAGAKQADKAAKASTATQGDPTSREATATPSSRGDTETGGSSRREKRRNDRPGAANVSSY